MVLGFFKEVCFSVFMVRLEAFWCGFLWFGVLVVLFFLCGQEEASKRRKRWLFGLF